MTVQDREFMTLAIELARNGVESNAGGPFGCIIVKNGEVVGRGNNRVTSTNDPTAHAEITAIRDACKTLGSFQLDGCSIYTSCEPCPMCLGAIYWARPASVFFACTRADAADIGFDDDFIYTELEKSNEDRKLVLLSLMRDEGIKVFRNWTAKADRIEY